MDKFHTNTVVIGAGVVGLAIAKEISSKDPEVIILEKERNIGQITSSRNSGVIHAGIYYPSDTLKAKFSAEYSPAFSISSSSNPVSWRILAQDMD